MPNKPEGPRRVYGPYSWDCGPFGRLTPLVLWFVRTVYIHETEVGIAIYKMFRGDMYMIGAARKMGQSEKAGLS